MTWAFSPSSDVISTPAPEQVMTKFLPGPSRSSAPFFRNTARGSPPRSTKTNELPRASKAFASRPRPRASTLHSAKLSLASMQLRPPRRSGSSTSAKCPAPSSPMSLPLKSSSVNPRFCLRPSAKCLAPRMPIKFSARSSLCNDGFWSSAAAKASVPSSPIAFWQRTRCRRVLFLIRAPANMLAPMSSIWLLMRRNEVTVMSFLNALTRRSISAKPVPRQLLSLRSSSIPLPSKWLSLSSRPPFMTLSLQVSTVSRVFPASWNPSTKRLRPQSTATSTRCESKSKISLPCRRTGCWFLSG
mmetsp:Transcript_70057/g.176509  ORF Transcript_70057/g.176509 Transcript_70057/m.176509 type:complete len:300 (-) Transcript_70057:576-1475(-)